MTTENTHDAIVIGAGSGGLTVAVGLSTFGKSVALIEANLVGGDCTNVGCIPSKLLLHHSTTGALAGDVLSTVRQRRDDLRKHEEDEYGTTDNIDLRYGHARLVGDGAVTSLRADHVIISTGSSPRRLAVDGLPGDRYLTNDELFELTEAPAKMVIVGAGPIGMEMAVAFRRLGTEIVVLDAAPQILPLMLPDAAAVVARTTTAMGIKLMPGLVAHGFDVDTISLAVGPLGGPPTDAINDVDVVLVAVGRVPNSEGLGLEDLGIETDRGRIVIDGKGRTNVDGVWAVGDVSTEGATTHAANAWGRRVIKHIVAPLAPAGARPDHPAVTYTSPEAATIGDQPVEVPGDVRRISYDFSKADRAYTDGVEDGVIIVDIRRFSGKVIGATVVGPRAGELISIFSLGMKAGVRFHKWYGTVWPYPSYADALGAVVDEYMVAAMKSVPSDALRWARGQLRR
jgi:dihydrolipoamide dehydrogenase